MVRLDEEQRQSRQDHVGSTGGTDGILYRLDPDGTISEWVSNLGVSNTVAWSPDRTRFYFGDSLANSVRCYDYDAIDGSISGERPFLEGFSRGVPDGSTVDAAGYLWNCRFYGGCIVRVAPDGAIDMVIEMPVQNVTTCTFGGENLTHCTSLLRLPNRSRKNWRVACLPLRQTFAASQKIDSPFPRRSIARAPCNLIPFVTMEAMECIYSVTAGEDKRSLARV